MTASREASAWLWGAAPEDMVYRRIPVCYVRTVHHYKGRRYVTCRISWFEQYVPQRVIDQGIFRERAKVALTEGFTLTEAYAPTDAESAAARPFFDTQARYRE